MPITQEKHRDAVANYLAGKVREFKYHLCVVVEACDNSSAAYRNGKPNPGDGPVVYGFSSLGNAMQSLKDALSAIGDEPLTWPQIVQLTHGDFMAKSRNAMTHDGNPVINAWADGRYFVANDISRLGLHREPIEIVRPQTDVRNVCLTFATQFCTLLSNRLKPLIGRYQIGGAGFQSGELEAAVQGSDLMPAEIKSLFAANSDLIREAIAQAPLVDPVATALDELERLRAYCSEALGQA